MEKKDTSRPQKVKNPGEIRKVKGTATVSRFQQMTLQETLSLLQCPQSPWPETFLLVQTSITVFLSQKHEKWVGLAPAGVELHGDFIRRRWERWLDGAGSGCLSCFRAVETLPVVQKFKPTFNKFVEFIPTSSICSKGISAFTLVKTLMFTSQQILEMRQKIQVFIAVLFKLVLGKESLADVLGIVSFLLCCPQNLYS